MRNVFLTYLLLNHFVQIKNMIGILKGDKSSKCDCLVCREFSLDSGKIYFPVQIAMIRVGLSII